MAGRKLPVLPTLADFPETGDLLYVVDVSDTSESPQGTSKQMQRETLLGVGTYTPTFSGEQNCTAAVGGSQPWHWTRVGKEVIVFGVSVMQLDALADGGEFLFSLPIEPDNDWSTSFAISGNMSVNSISIGDLPNLTNFALTADRDTPSKNARITVQLDVAAAGSEVILSFSLQYSINN